jgi:hypothetical protein
MVDLQIEEQGKYAATWRSRQMNKVSLILLSSAGALCACSTPVISDINGSAVKVQAAWYNNESEAVAEANRGCSLWEACRAD